MSSLLGLSTSAMFANNAALRTISNNIANSNTPGYSRQQVELVTEPGQYTGAGFFGHGVKVITVSRTYNEFLTREAAKTQSQVSSDQTRLDHLQQLENLFPPGDAGIGAAATQFFNGFTDVASTPQDLSARQVVLSSADELAGRIRTTSLQIDTLQQGVVADMNADASMVNTLAEQVAKLNSQISAVRGTGQPPNDLMDQRDLLINRINQYVQVATLDDADGSIGLFVGGGQVLVLGGSANRLTVTADTFDPNKARLSVEVAGFGRELSTATVAGGSLMGLLNFQDLDLVDARNMVGQLAAALSARVNEQQSFGLDLNNAVLPAANRVGGAPIFSVGAPTVQNAATNAAPDTLIDVAVFDATQLQASSYLLEFDGTDFQLSRRGGVAGALTQTITAAQVAAGYSIDGFTLGPMTGTPPAAGDRFMLQPVAEAGLRMQRALADPRGIAAAAPVNATVAANNTGTAAVASLSITSAPSAPPYAPYYIYFSSTTAGAVADQYAIYDASIPPPPGAAPSLTTAAPLTPGITISYNGIDITFTGVPHADDVIKVDPTTYAGSNNGNAQALLNLRDNAMVGRTPSGLGTILPGATASQAYAEAMSNVGVRVQGAKATADISQSISENARMQLSNLAGVNLDEEASRLIQFQQSYQAAAKILQVAQTIFDAMLNAAS